MPLRLLVCGLEEPRFRAGQRNALALDRSHVQALLQRRTWRGPARFTARRSGSGRSNTRGRHGIGGSYQSHFHFIPF